MAWRRIRDYLPKGLYWRSLLIIVLPVALMQIIVTAEFLDDHWRATSKRMSQGVAADVAMLIQLYERDPTPARFEDIRKIAKQPLQLEINLEPDGKLAKKHCRPLRSVVDGYLIKSLTAQLSRPVWYDASCPGDHVEIRVPIDEGILRVLAYRDRVQARSGPLFVAWTIGATALLITVSIVFIRNQVRPIEQLASAMERFGRGLEAGPFKPRGAREVRQAARAFLGMQARIRRHIDQRGQLLAGVSHDLRTPLTRLKLQLALMPPSDDLAAARADLADMEATLEEYLAFARGQWAEEVARIDLGALVVEAARRAGIEDAVTQEGDLSADVRPTALRRCLANLIDNAAAHGDSIAVAARRIGETIEIDVEDDGPGIAPELYEDAFRPFSRLDETRTRHSKGVGLGLSIARDAARSHGGEVTLSRSPLGGLRARLTIPAAATSVRPAAETAPQT